MWTTLKKAKGLGIFELPISKIMDLFKHRKKFAQIEKAFFYHRYCNALFLAQKIGLFNALCERSYTLAELSQKLTVPEQPLKTLSLNLNSQGFIEKKGHKYLLSEFGELFLKGEGPFSSNYLLELMADQALGLSSSLESIRDGSIPSHVDIRDESGNYKAFLSAVNNYLLWCGRELIAKADLGNPRSMIVGSMGVSFSSLLLQKFPEMKVTYGCLEHLVKEIPRFCKLYQVSNDRIQGMHSHSGDPMEDDWGDTSYDLILLTRKMIIDPKQKVGEKFAQKAFEVLNPGGKAIFWETVYPEKGRMPLRQAMEVVFDFCTSPSALTRSKADYNKLLKSIGFKKVQVYDCLEGQTHFIVAEK